MDDTLCDELVQEIFQKLPPNSSSSITLVSKRWLSLYRASKSSLSLRLSLHTSIETAETLQSLSALLSRFPSLSSVSLTTTATATISPAINFSDELLSCVSSLCPRLASLRFLSGPVSLSSLVSLSRTSNNLTSLSINLSRPLSLRWLVNFRCLRDLSIFLSKTDLRERGESEPEVNDDEGNDNFIPKLGIETLCLSGTRIDDYELGFLWKSVGRGNLKKLQLRSCEGLGDGGSFSSVSPCLAGIRELEIRTCRTIVDGVLIRLAEVSESLESLLVYDGGSREGLARFFAESRSRLRRLDLRLPLDLSNDHLAAISGNFGGSLSSLRLQSCCLVTGEGLKTLGLAASSALEELALINCDVVEREPGLLATLGQSLRSLRKLDLSYNETFGDKELVSFAASCRGLVELGLRGCRGLTGSAIVSAVKACPGLEHLDVTHCVGVDSEAVETVLASSSKLRRLSVEEGKVSEAAMNSASAKYIEIIA